MLSVNRTVYRYGNGLEGQIYTHFYSVMAKGQGEMVVSSFVISGMLLSVPRRPRDGLDQRSADVLSLVFFWGIDLGHPTSDLRYFHPGFYRFFEYRRTTGLLLFCFGLLFSNHVRRRHRGGQYQPVGHRQCEYE